MYNKAPFSFWTFLILGCLLAAFSIAWFPANIIAWDVFGYYLYLPMTFIYGDLQVQDVSVIKELMAVYNPSSTFYQAFELPNGNWVMKYSSGMAILYLPAFALGHIGAWLFSFPMDGFSKPYQIGMLVEMIGVLILGLWLLRKVLLTYFSDKVVAAVLVLVTLGTNYWIGNTLVGGGVQTHGYLFTLYAAILYFAIRWHKEFKLRDIVLLGLACGITILSRPSEIVCLFIPLLWGVSSWKTLGDKLRLMGSKWGHLLLFSFLVLAVGSVQLFYWKYVTGSFFHYSYGGSAGEAFNFQNPHVVDVLFSYRKGWFVYTPIMFLATLGLIMAIKRKAMGILGLTAYVVFNMYIVSSWHCWWYAECFGQRSLIQSYPVMAIGLGHIFLVDSKRLRLGAYMAAGALLVLSVFQSYQFERGVIDASRETRAYYWASFFDRKPNPENEYLKLVKRDDWEAARIGDESNYNVVLKKIYSYEDQKTTGRVTIDSIGSVKGNYYARLVGEYSDEQVFSFSEFSGGHYIWIRVSAYVKPLKDLGQHPISITMGTHHKDFMYKYQALDSENLDLKVGEWNYLSMDYLSPEMRAENDNFKAFIWNRGGNELLIDDYKLEVFIPKFDPVR